jgi:hypothetical protein
MPSEGASRGCASISRPIVHSEVVGGLDAMFHWRRLGEWKKLLFSPNAKPGSPALPATDPAECPVTAPSWDDWPLSPKRFRHRTGRRTR